MTRRPIQERRVDLRPFVMVGALFCAGVGSVGMAAWYLGLTALIQVHAGATPMMFNAALAFVLTGLAIAAATRARRRIALAAALGDVVLTGLTLAEDLANRGLGVDQLFVSAYIRLPHSAAGRPGTAAAVCFLGTGASIGAYVLRPTPRRVTGVAVAGGLTMAIAGIAFFGYATGTRSAYAWGAGNVTAPNTAVVLMLLGAVGCATSAVLATPGEGTGTGRSNPMAGVAAVLAATAVISGSGVLLAIDYNQSHSHAAADASAMAQDIDALTGIAFRASTPGADLEALRTSGTTTAVEAQALLDGLTKTGFEPATVEAMGTLLTQYWAVLTRAETAVFAGDAATGRDIALQATGVAERLVALSASVVKELRREADRADQVARGSILALLALMALVLSWSLTRVGRRRRRDEVEAAAYAARARFEAMVTNASDLIITEDANGYITYVSPSIRTILGYEPQSWLGQGRFHVLHPDHEDRVARLHQAAVETGMPRVFDAPVRHADGSWRTLEVTLAALGGDGTGAMLWTCRDVTEQRVLQEELVAQALHDSLTGLPNRALIQDRLAHALARCSRDGSEVAVLLLDLDGFKEINDSFGHNIGDEVLMQVAAQLRRAVRPGDTAGRLGGDEFVVVIEDSSADAAARGIATRLQRLLEYPIRAGSTTHHITASGGIACGAAGRGEDLIRNADLAMYAAKAIGRGHVESFRPEMHTAAKTHSELSEDLVGAIDRCELEVYYQPTFDLMTGELVGAEALLRWNHPVRGLIMPASFIPLAERGQHIIPIGRWVLEEACRQAAAWGWDAIPGTWSINVNVSAVQLSDPAFVDDVRSILDHTGLSPSTLVLELTESVLMEDKAAIERINALKAVGVRLAIDDFGTGYSSLSQLRRFPVDEIKIDKSFVDRLPGPGSTLVRAIVAMAGDLGVVTQAEGIESLDQARALRDLGCRLGQGFWLGHPMPASAMESLMSSPVAVGTG